MTINAYEAERYIYGNVLVFGFVIDKKKDSLDDNQQFWNHRSFLHHHQVNQQCKINDKYWKGIKL